VEPFITWAKNTTLWKRLETDVKFTYSEMKLLTHDVYKDIIALKFTNGYIFIVDLKTSLMPYKKRTFAGDDDEEEVVVMESEYEKVNNEDLIYLGHNKDKLNAERLYSFKLIFVN